MCTDNKYMYFFWTIFLMLFILHSVDNSEYMRNGDFLPTRLQAQQDAVNIVCHSKTRSNPENNVGLITMAKWDLLCFNGCTRMQHLRIVTTLMWCYACFQQLWGAYHTDSRYSQDTVQTPCSPALWKHQLLHWYQSGTCRFTTVTKVKWMYDVI